MEAPVCRQVDQQVKVTAVVVLSLNDGTIDPPVGRAMAACHRHQVRIEELQALSDRRGGCVSHPPSPICSLTTPPVSPPPHRPAAAGA